MTRVAFLGLGSMGSPMALRLVRAGYDVTVWNRSAGRTTALAEAGAAVAASPAEAVADAEIVVTMLADPAAVEAVVGSFASALRPDAVLVEMSTVGPDATKHIRELVPVSVAMVDAPVMGSIDKAEAGELAVLAGGDVARVSALLGEFGQVTDCGELGAGSARKLVLVTAIIAGVALVGEAVALADRLGVDGRAVIEASPLAGLAGRAYSTTAYFSATMAAKDLGLAGEVRELPVMAAARQWLQSMPDQNADLGAVVEHIRETAK